MSAKKSMPKTWEELRYGPYHPPRGARLRAILFCENQGTVRVCGFSDGSIGWPIGIVPGARGGRGLVLCGDLVRAVRLEANMAVQRAWGVSKSTVCRWRGILGVERSNPGSHHYSVTYASKQITRADVRARGHAKQTPEHRTERMARARQAGRMHKLPWTPAEDALLGTMPDPELARRLGCHPRTVWKRRKELGLPSVYGPVSAAVMKASTAGLLRYSQEKMRARRLALGLYQTQVAQRCGWKGGSGRYYRLESGGGTYITPRVLARVAKALECRVEDLSEGPRKGPRKRGQPRKRGHH